MPWVAGRHIVGALKERENGPRIRRLSCPYRAVSIWTITQGGALLALGFVLAVLQAA